MVRAATATPPPIIFYLHGWLVDTAAAIETILYTNGLVGSPGMALGVAVVHMVKTEVGVVATLIHDLTEVWSYAFIHTLGFSAEVTAMVAEEAGELLGASSLVAPVNFYTLQWHLILIGKGEEAYRNSRCRDLHNTARNIINGNTFTLTLVLDTFILSLALPHREDFRWNWFDTVSITYFCCVREIILGVGDVAIVILAPHIKPEHLFYPREELSQAFLGIRQYIFTSLGVNQI